MNVHFGFNLVVDDLTHATLQLTAIFCRPLMIVTFSNRLNLVLKPNSRAGHKYTQFDLWLFIDSFTHVLGFSYTLISFGKIASRPIAIIMQANPRV